MIKRVALQHGKRAVILMDSISHVTPDDAGQIVVSASHGGASSAKFATQQKLAAVFFNDAGIVALGILDNDKVPAGAVGHRTARIGDAEDTWQHGVISHLNESGQRCGLRKGERLQEAVARLLELLP